MAKTARPKQDSAKRRSPARTPEAQEDQMISMAYDLAAEQLRNGTASSQVISHFLKLGSPKARLETEILQHQKELVAAKTEAIKSSARMEELYKDAIDAMRSYSGGSVANDDENLQ